MENVSGQNIISPTMSFAGTGNGRFFDTDQANMADVLEGGNSTVAGCAGTYRNGTDVLVGLDYGASPVSPCDPLARTGFVGSDMLASASFETLVFEFTDFQSGDVFEFDADTDGNGSQAASDMAGMLVRVTLADGRTCDGVMVADSVDPNLAETSLR